MNTVSIADEAQDPPASAPIKSLYIWIVASIAALGGFLFGYDWVVIGGAKPFYEKFFALTLPSQQGWAMSCALIGCLLGALASGALSEKYGRKRPLILAAVIFCLSSIGTAMAGHFQVFVFWRILGGFAIGLASSLSPVYIAELAPAHLRGKLVSLNQLTIVCGILLAQVVNWLIARPISPTATAREILNSWNGQVGWRWMFGVTAIPSVLFLGAMFFVPESPRWLSRHGAADKAKAVLSSIGGKSYSEAVYTEIQSSIAAEHSEASLQTLLQPKIRRILWLGIFLAVLQQWCGINVIFNYAEEVFAAAGFPVSDILFNIVITGAVNVLFTIVALLTVDRFGRRVLMLLTDSAGLAIIYTLLGLTLLLPRSRPTDAAAGSGGNCVLCHVSGTGNLGGDCRNFSQQDPQQPAVSIAVTALMERVLRAHLHLPFSKPRVGGIGNLLDICSDLRSRLRLPCVPPA